jgi:hypothetical protein
MLPYELRDFDGRLIEVGTPVRIFDFDPTHPDFKRPNTYMGRVVEIDDWDGDVDEDGRPISIPPNVIVEWQDGSQEFYASSEWEWTTVPSEDGWPERWPVLGRVEDLAVIGPPEVGSVVLRSRKGSRA